MSETTPGWQADPTGRFEHRYWDGAQWTDNVSNAGVASTDAFTSAAPAAPVEPAAPTADAPGWGDPTITQPAAPTDPTATWPAPPVPPSAVPPAAGSKKGLLVGGGILAAVVVAVVAFLLLGGDDDKADLDAENATDFSITEQTIGGDDTIDTSGLIDPGSVPADFEQQLASVYESGLGLSKDQAECLAGKISSAVESGDLSEDQAMSEIFSYLSDCDIDMNDISGN
jgi:hypothetical protein